MRASGLAPRLGPGASLSAGKRLGAMLLVVVLFVSPLVWMIAASLRPIWLGPPTQFELWPAETTLEGYRTLFALLPFGQYALSSLSVVAVAVPVTLLTASWAGFAMSQLSPRLRHALVVVSVATLLVPLMSLWLTRFLIFKWLGVIDTLWVLMLPALFGTSPFYVLILYWAFRRLPPDLIDAARMDGCDTFRAWWRVAMPLARPALLAVGVLSFVKYWNSFVEPMLYITNQSYYTLPVALHLLQQLHPSRWSILMAGAVIVTVPALLAFVVAQRFFLQEHRGDGVLQR